MNTRQTPGQLQLGIGWRPELAQAIVQRPDLGFLELMAEDFDARDPLPQVFTALQQRGVTLIPHGVSLSLGGAEPLAHERLTALARLAERVNAPLVSEHIAFVRGGGRESGHLLPVPRTRASLELLVANIRTAQRVLPVPLALENIATLVEWPDAEMDEAAFVTALLEQTEARLLLDVENLYANARNHNTDPCAFLDRLPLERLAYVHVAGGLERGEFYHDTHAHAVPQAVLDLLSELAARAQVPGVMLERDGNFPPPEELNAELDALQAAVQRGAARRAPARGELPARWMETPDVH